MSADYSILDTGSVNTPYRPNVRRLIPIKMQEAIRAECGDQPIPGKELFTYLPSTCDLQIAPGEAAAAAAILRANPQLMQDLQWHMAAQAALLANIPAFETTTTNLRRRIAGIKQHHANPAAVEMVVGHVGLPEIFFDREAAVNSACSSRIGTIKASKF